MLTKQEFVKQWIDAGDTYKIVQIGNGGYVYADSYSFVSADNYSLISNKYVRLTRYDNYVGQFNLNDVIKVT